MDQESYYSAVLRNNNVANMLTGGASNDAPAPTLSEVGKDLYNGIFGKGMAIHGAMKTHLDNTLGY